MHLFSGGDHKERLKQEGRYTSGLWDITRWKRVLCGIMRGFPPAGYLARGSP